MPFPTVNPGQVAALTASYIQHPTLDPTQPQAMFTSGGQYLRSFLGGNDNLIWSNSSLTYDTTRNKILSVCNGGHADSGDNSVYEFDTGGTQTWSRVFNATFVAAGNLIPALAAGIPSVYTDTAGTFGPVNQQYPAARHSYQGNIYMPSVGTVWLAGGVRWEQVGSTLSEIWWYDPVAHTFALQAESFSDGAGISAAWDPHLYRVYYHGQSQLRYYDPALPAGTRIHNVSGDEGQWTSASMSACFDWKRRRYVMLGWNSTFGGTNLYYYDLMSNPESSTRVIQSLTAGGFPGVDITVGFPGLVYDVIRDKYIVSLGATTFQSSPLVYGGTANILWSIDPDTFVSTPLTFTGDTVALRSTNSPCSNLIHDIADDVYIYLSTFRQNQYAFRHPDQTRVYALPNRTFTEKTRWARGSGPEGGANQDKLTQWVLDRTRQQIVTVGGNVDGSRATPPFGGKSANGNNEMWRGAFHQPAWTQLQSMTLTPASSGVVPDTPEDIAFTHDTVNDRYLLMPGFFNSTQLAPRTRLTTAITPLSPSIGEKIFVSGETLQVDGVTWGAGDLSAFPASGLLYCYPQNGVGGSQEVIAYSAKTDAPGGEHSFTVSGRAQLGTTAQNFAVDSRIAKNGAYGSYNPTGPVADWGVYEMDPTVQIDGWAHWQRGAYGFPAQGGGGDSASVAIFDYRANGTKSMYRTNYNGRSYFQRLDRTTLPGTWVASYGIGSGSPTLVTTAIPSAVSPGAGQPIFVGATSDDVVWPTRGVVAIGDHNAAQSAVEYVLYNGKNASTGAVTVVQRGYLGTAAAHPTTDECRTAQMALASADISLDRLALDAGKGYIYFVAHKNGDFQFDFSVAPHLCIFDLATFTGRAVAPMPPAYLGSRAVNFVGEQYLFFDPLNRVIEVPNNTGQWSGPTVGWFVYHPDLPAHDYGVTNAPGWENDTSLLPAGLQGNRGIHNEFVNASIWGILSTPDTTTDWYRRYWGGPTTASATVLTLSSLSPSSGLAGNACNLSGLLFGASQGTSVVHFGGGTATPLTWSDNTITITVPSVAPGTYNVSVTVGAQTSNALPFTVTTNAPTITLVSPASGPVLTTVTITGTNFGLNQLVSSLTIGGAFAPVISWGDTQIIATVPNTLGQGAQQVVVTTVNGSASSTFTVTPPLPTLDMTFEGLIRDRVGQGDTALAPDGAPDGVFTVTLHGAGGRTITSLRLDMSNSVGTNIGTWDTTASNLFWVLGVADSFNGAYRNNAVTMAVNFFVADGGTFVLFASDLGGTEFVNGNFATVTMGCSDGTVTTKQIQLTPPAPPPPSTVSVTLLPYGRGNF